MDNRKSERAISCLRLVDVRVLVLLLLDGLKHSSGGSCVHVSFICLFILALSD